MINDLEFQSTPAITGGRDTGERLDGSWVDWFQSTPAITGGRDAGRVAVQQRRTVSIHARHYWRARHRRETHHADHKRFNPRPPLLAGETSCRQGIANAGSWFQSTPAITGGRDSSAVPSITRLASFQSTPAITGGRDSLERWIEQWRNEFQSTPAITGGRDSSSPCLPDVLSCFNPRPQLLAGETANGFDRAARDAVSIHARHYWRARPLQHDLVDYAPGVSIHARHYWRARRLGERAQPSTCVFQSTPAITGGRDAAGPVGGAHADRFNPRPPLLAGETASGWATGFSTACFNPRPPLLAGETLPAPGPTAPIRVSIHARHYWRARPFCGVGTLTAGEVSIHARHYWRARHVFTQAADMILMFQSTPAITGGRDVAPSTAPGTEDVSIHARHYGRARRNRICSRPCCPSFNPRPPLLAGETLQRRPEGVTNDVSIHARHYWRARRTTRRCRARDVLFQSTPAITGGRDALIVDIALLPVAVSIHARHYWRARPPPRCPSGVDLRRFNPRPPLLAGETTSTRWR